MTELYFKGKEFVYNHHLAVPHRPLVPDPGKSVGVPDLSGNLIIQGDNLHALKSLLPTHAGEVDCIFIDPPYNTGNENWRYNDNVNAPMIRDWLDENPVGVEDGLRHDKWCAMMWPRLKLLHELLADTGSLWMTLDDNEVHRGKLLLDEIFGQKNFVANYVWKARSGKDHTAKHVSMQHENVLCFAKQKSTLVLSRDVRVSAGGKFSDARGSYQREQLRQWGTNDRRIDRPTMFFCVIAPDGTEVFPIKENGDEGCWRVNQKRLKQMLEQDQVDFVLNDGKWSLFAKKYAGRETSTAYHSMFLDCGTSSNGTKEIKQIFGTKFFDTPKPVGLVSHVLKLADNPDSLILDSFAGSGTTAHAVLKANAEDGGNRKFILVEMEEGIADPVTAERVRRVINGYDHDGKTTAGLGGAFTFCTLGDPIDLDRILTGEDLPAWDALAPVLYHMATNRTLDPAACDAERYFVGEAGDDHVWMLYRPDLEWLKSDAAALTLDFAKKIQADAPERRHLVFAPARYVSEAVLRDHGLNVAYVPFPNALYRVTREG